MPNGLSIGLPLNATPPQHAYPRLDVVRTEGDSLMDGAYGYATHVTLADLIGAYALIDTSEGGATMSQIRDRVLAADNAHLLAQTTVIWDGSANGLVTVPIYLDLLAEAIRALRHNRFVIVPPLQPHGAADTGDTVAEQLRDGMLARWPANVLDWRDCLDNIDGAVAPGEFHDAPNDPWHLSQSGIDHIAVGIARFLASKGWIPGYGEDLMLAPGSVWLFDPSLAGGEFAGVPADSDVLPNAAAPIAATLLGTGDANSLGTYVSGYGLAGPHVALERTAKRGLHAILGQASDYGGATGLLVQPNALIQTYLDTHVDDDWYFSLWLAVTRRPGNPPDGDPAENVAPQSPMHKLQYTGNFLLTMQDLSPRGGWSSPPQLGKLSLPSEQDYAAVVLGQPLLRTVGTSGFTGAQPALINNGLGHNNCGLHVALGALDAYDYYNDGCAPSIVLYRAYAENLTVSGRSYAAAETLDTILWREAFSATGRFGGDSYSDPDAVLA